MKQNCIQRTYIRRNRLIQRLKDRDLQKVVNFVLERNPFNENLPN